MAKELTPAEYEKMMAAGKVSSSNNANLVKPILIVVAVIVLCGVSFAIGESYGKKHGTAANGTASRNGGPGGFFGGGDRSGNRPAIGQVTAVSADSITIKNTRDGSSQTFKITSSTTVTNDGSSAAVSDIKTGDTVFVRASSSDSGTADQIMLNPSFGGGMGGPGGNSGTTDGTSDGTTSD